MQNPKQFQQNWADEPPFFNFEIPYGGLIVFEGGNVDAVEADLINRYEDDNLIPMLRLTDTEHPYIKDMEASKPPQYRDKKIKCVILPIRYKKVFRA